MFSDWRQLDGPKKLGPNQNWLAALEIYVESSRDISYTATRDGQGPMHNLRSEAFLSFITCLSSDDLVGNTLLDASDVVASARARSFRRSATTD
jgi:hypothetical protein